MKCRGFFRSRFGSRTAAGCVLAAALLGDGRAEAAPVISFEQTALTISGLTPGGRAVLFSVAWDSEKGAAQLVRRESVLPDNDGDGQVRKDLGKAVPERSVWFAVDLDSGRYTVALPGRYVLDEVVFPSRFGADDGGRLDFHRTFIQAVLVRPKVGAWGARARDGQPSDPDGTANRLIQVRLNRMWSLGDSPPAPQVLEDGDIFLIVDPDQGEYMAHQVRR